MTRLLTSGQLPSLSQALKLLRSILLRITNELKTEGKLILKKRSLRLIKNIQYAISSGYLMMSLRPLLWDLGHLYIAV